MSGQVEHRRQGCPGQFLRVSGTTAAICYGCARYGARGPQIEPRAAVDPATRAWSCTDRLTPFATGNSSEVHP